MSLRLMLLVLAGAALHAGWNVIVKASAQPSTEVVLVAISAAVFAAMSLPFLPLPAMACWPYLTASVTVHALYFTLVGLAYRHSELSYAYPLMRGAAPLFTAIVASVVVQEPLGIGGWLSISLLSCGVLTLGADSLRSGRFSWQATGFGLLNAAVIVSYTMVDGLGVRLSGNPASYVQWMFFLNALPLVALYGLRGRIYLLGNLRSRWKMSALGGLCAIGSYGVALWAMSRAPLALVAALRESSVLFGTVFAAVLLKERFGFARYAAAALVAAGAIAMKVF